MLKTRRLQLLPVSDQDFDFLSSFYSRAECTEYIPSPMVSIDILIQNRVKHWSKYGIGTYSTRLNNKIIGYCGIEYIPDSQDADIRFGFSRSFWGHGYALEAAKACIDDVFNSNKLEKVWGAAIPANLASLSILKKLGMKPDSAFKHYGEAVVTYSINR